MPNDNEVQQGQVQGQVQEKVQEQVQGQEDVQNNQVQTENEQQDSASFDSEFDAGFNINADEEERTEDPGSAGDTERSEAPEGADTQERTVTENYYIPPEQTYPVPDEQEAQQTVQSQQQIQPQQKKTVSLVEIDEDLKSEFEELKKINRDSAYLATTDTPLGQRLRKILNENGAEMADLLAQRELDRYRTSERIKQQQYADQRAQIESRNREYFSTLQKEAPELYTLLKDPNKKKELGEYHKQIFDWINAKPYKEGVEYMRIAQNGNAHEVAMMLNQMKKERASSRRNDPTGAIAVPNRGNSVPPPNIGDKDSFDAGWNINLHANK